MGYVYKYSRRNRLDASTSIVGGLLFFAVLIYILIFVIKGTPPTTTQILDFVFGSILVIAASTTILYLIFSFGSFILSVYIDENGISGPNLYGAQKWIPWEEMDDCLFETILGIPHLIFIAKDRTEVRMTTLIEDFDEFLNKVPEFSTPANLPFTNIFLDVVNDLL